MLACLTLFPPDMMGVADYMTGQMQELQQSMKVELVLVRALHWISTSRCKLEILVRVSSLLRAW